LRWVALLRVLAIRGLLDVHHLLLGSISVLRGLNARGGAVVHLLNRGAGHGGGILSAHPAHLNRMLGLHASYDSVVHAIHAVLYPLGNVNANDLENAEHP